MPGAGAYVGTIAEEGVFGGTGGSKAGSKPAFGRAEEAMAAVACGLAAAGGGPAGATIFAFTRRSFKSWRALSVAADIASLPPNPKGFPATIPPEATPGELAGLDGGGGLRNSALMEVPRVATCSKEFTVMERV